MAKVQIEPKILKGFRDTLPDAALLRQQMIRTLEEVFSSFGLVPIDTPALEYAEILLGKGSSETDKQMYRFKDQGDRDIALRFDLTIPLARFAAMYINELGTPFKRYHIAPVWRAEKPQRGRYREFIQCDFDIIGSESILADVEVLAIINRAFNQLKISHTMRVNNRMVLNGMLERLGARERSVSVLRAIDKIEKLGPDVVREELTAVAQLNSEQIGLIFRYLELGRAGLGNDRLLTELRQLLEGAEESQRGISQLQELLDGAVASGVNPDCVMIDVSIARGLDYYTGTVVETRMNELPEIGSICSGGRYDNLASLYTNRKLPGVGASIGLDRVLGALEEMKRIERRASSAQVFIPIFDEQSKISALRLAGQLREANLAIESSTEIGGLGGQLKYADKKGIPLAVILGGNEIERGVCSLKDLRSGVQSNDIPLNSLADKIRSVLGLK